MGSIQSPFGFTSTAEEVSQGIDLKGKGAILTGAASGIGVETARTLALRGAEVTMAVRNVRAGKEVAEHLKKKTGNSKIDVDFLELSDLESVVAFVNKWQKPLHILINNAGIMASPEQYTESGLEMQFATNHLGHFALACGLRRHLAEDKHARIVCVSSSGHLLSPVVFDDINYAFRTYEPWGAYGQSKSAVNLSAVGITARWKKYGITANSLNPGAIKTNLQRHVGNILRSPPELHKTVEQGAATSVFLATSPLVEGIGGKYFVDCNEAKPVDRRPKDPTEMTRSVAPYSLDPKNADRLWEKSVEFLRRELSSSLTAGWFE
jgi:NAD(P)-dependent dehydrogenase (short-subunit alcohol dehydrogenase family)